MRVSVLRTLPWSALLALCLLARPGAAQEVSDEYQEAFGTYRKPDGA